MRLQLGGEHWDAKFAQQQDSSDLSLHINRDIGLAITNPYLGHWVADIQRMDNVRGICHGWHDVMMIRTCLNMKVSWCSVQ